MFKSDFWRRFWVVTTTIGNIIVGITVTRHCWIDTTIATKMCTIAVMLWLFHGTFSYIRENTKNGW